MKRRVKRSAEEPRVERAAPRHASPQQLLQEAEIARRASYSPYSRFAVGAALLTRTGRILHGCNVENASFGLSVCAERTALWKAVSEGERDFVAVAITAGPGAVPSPCGACRQVLHEFAPNLWVYWRDAQGRIIGRKLEELLASPFVFVDPPARSARRTAKKRPAAGRKSK
jgi:cytidine deaminase